MKTQTTVSMRRRGATAVEMAIIAPVLLTILFGIIECGWYFMARQMVHNAAMEGVRLAILPGWSSGQIQAQVQTRLQNTLGSASLANWEFALDPATGPNDPCAAVTVRVKTQDIALPGWILQAAGLAGPTDKIVFKRWMASQDPAMAGTPGAPCGPPP